MRFLYTEANVINVFTDASTSSLTKDQQSISTVGSGYLVINQNQCVSSEVRVFTEATSQFGELYAIFMGISDLFRDVTYKRYHGIDVDSYYIYNVFSDSLYSINTITQYAPKWLTYNPLVESDDQGNKVPPILLNSDGKPIQNQECICQIVALIIAMNVRIRFYHIKSHLNPDNDTHIKTFYKDFFKSSNLKHNIEIPLSYAKDMIRWNNEIDKLTRQYVHSLKDQIQSGSIQWPLQLFPNSREQVDAYQKLLK